MISNSLEETEELAREVASGLKAGDVLFLQGGLGAGKTSFSAALARGLGVLEPVLSPTFQIAREYFSGQLPLLHIDAYRLATAGLQGEDLWRELETAGLETSFEGIILLEWGSSLEQFFPRRIEIKFEIISEESRRIEVTKCGF